MIVNKSWIELFFASVNKSFMLNILYVLRFMLQVPAHHNRFNEIFVEAGVALNIVNFAEVVADTVTLYEKDLEKHPAYFMKDFTIESGVINVMEDTPIYWFFMAIYWGYDFKNNTKDVISKCYNWQIGDIALKTLLYFLKMEQKKISTGKTVSIGFYTDLSARLVRVLDILIAMSKEKNAYINYIYFVDEDLALNFFQVQCHNPWLRDVFSIIKDTNIDKNVFQFYHENEGIKFYARGTRMVKKSALNSLCETLKKLRKLYNLETKKSTHTSSGIRIPKEKSSTLPSSTYKLIEHVDELSQEFIYEDIDFPAGADADTKAEARVKANVCTRQTKPVETYEDDTQGDKEYVIPNGYVQNKRNKAFSSSVTKQNLLLQSDYNIPPVEHLKEFIQFLQQGVQDV